MRKPLLFLVLCLSLGVVIVFGALLSHDRLAKASPSWKAAQTPAAAPLEPWQEHAQKLALMKAKPVDQFTDAERLALISWLNDDIAAEHQRFAATHEMIPDGKKDYFIDLAVIEARLRDKRSLPALVTVMDVSQTIEAFIASFGDDAVAPVTAQLTNPEQRFSAVQTLGFLLDARQQNKNPPSSQSADQIQKQLLALTADSSGLVRRLAVRALEFAKPTPETVRAVRKLSLRDPYQVSVHRDRSIILVYPVREAAKDTLKAWAK